MATPSPRTCGTGQEPTPSTFAAELPRSPRAVVAIMATVARRTKDGDGHRRPTPRAPLPPRAGGEPEDEGLTHADLVDDLRAIDGLEDVTGGADDRPSFHLRHKPFLHFHVDKPTGLI